MLLPPTEVPCPKFPLDDRAYRRTDGTLWCPVCQTAYHPDFLALVAGLRTLDEKQLID